MYWTVFCWSLFWSLNCWRAFLKTLSVIDFFVCYIMISKFRKLILKFTAKNSKSCKSSPLSPNWLLKHAGYLRLLFLPLFTALLAYLLTKSWPEKVQVNKNECLFQDCFLNIYLINLATRWVIILPSLLATSFLYLKVRRTLRAPSSSSQNHLLAAKQKLAHCFGVISAAFVMCYFPFCRWSYECMERQKGLR